MKHRSAYFTPRDVADGLAQLVPESATSILDPSAGVGDLLISIAPRLSSNASFVCVEKSPHRLKELAANLRHLGNRVKVIQDDFLKWDASSEACDISRFDCITMNPPFSAKRSTWVASPKLAQKAVFSQLFPEKMPIEVAFVVKAISFLRAGGKLISIVPGSVVAGSAFQYLRDALQRVGRISLVHELPPFSFRGIESTFYVLAFHNERRTRRLNILNHSWNMPERLRLSHSASEGMRLDFGYLIARQRLASIVLATRALCWKPLDQIAGVTRGTISAPFDKNRVVHSSN